MERLSRWVRSPVVWIVAVILLLLVALGYTNDQFLKENKRLLALCVAESGDRATYQCEKDFQDRAAQKAHDDAVAFAVGVGSGIVVGSRR